MEELDTEVEWAVDEQVIISVFEPVIGVSALG